jgi:signal transduction histidine kinase
LLLELRPSHISTTPFPALLRQLVAAVQGRKRMEIALEFEGEPVLLPEVQVVIYRIVQESLNNITKHARASQLEIRGRGGAGFIEVVIRDNGVGFPANGNSSGMGLHMMHERASEINAHLEIFSQVGNGTDVVLYWPNDHQPTLKARQTTSEPHSPTLSP